MLSEKQKMIEGQNYFSNDKELVIDRQKAKKLLHQLNVTEYLMNGNARQILKQLLPNANKQIYIEPPFYCDYGYNIFLGSNVYFNINCVVLDSAIVTVGNNVLIGPNVQFYSATHPTNADERKKIEYAKPVTIGNDCWIGGGTIILPGVTIGNRCTIGAGSVVNKNIPDNSLAAGNPAKIIRSLI